MKQIVEINAKGISSVFHNHVRRTVANYQIFKVSLETINIERMKECVNRPIGTTAPFKVGDVTIGNEEVAKENCQGWLHDRCLEQFFVAVLYSMVEAANLLELIQIGGSAIEVDRYFKIDSKNLSLSFQQIKVNIETILGGPLELIKEIESIKIARNIKHHRRGIVQKDNFSIQTQEMRMFINDGDSEKRIEDTIGTRLEKGGKVILKVCAVNRPIEKGSQIDLGEQDLSDILLTCFTFNAKLEKSVNEYVRVALRERS